MYQPLWACDLKILISCFTWEPHWLYKLEPEPRNCVTRLLPEIAASSYLSSDLLDSKLEKQSCLRWAQIHYSSFGSAEYIIGHGGKAGKIVLELWSWSFQLVAFFALVAAASARPQTINYELPGGQATLTFGPSSAPAPTNAKVLKVAPAAPQYYYIHQQSALQNFGGVSLLPAGFNSGSLQGQNVILVSQ